jgi:hypothetical protein
MRRTGLRPLLHPEELAEPLLPAASADAAEEPDRARAALWVVASAAAAVWAPRVRSGKVNCARCGTPIYPGEDWDLGHEDGTGRVVAGTHPEHARCNRATNRGSSGRRKSVDLGGRAREW